MKTINIIKPFLAVCLLATASVSNADVWAPVTADSTFFTLQALLNQSSTDTFGITLPQPPILARLRRLS